MEPEVRADRALTLEESLYDSRHRGFRYSGVISDELLSQFTAYVERNNELPSLDDELGILRYFVSLDLKQLSAAVAMPKEDSSQLQRRAVAIAVARDCTYESISKLEQLALSVAKLKVQEQGKVDLVMLNALVTAVTKSVDVGLRHFEEPMVAGGTDPQRVSDHIASLVSSAVEDIAPGGLVTEQSALTRKTQITTDMLVQEMDTFHLQPAELPFTAKQGNREVL